MAKTIGYIPEKPPKQKKPAPQNEAQGEKK